MPEELKTLIEKIQKEGVQAAQDTARQIEDAARARAEEIVAQARRDADGILAAARTKDRQSQESGTQALQQAARNTVLALRQEITAMLNKVAAAGIRQALSGQAIADIVYGMVHAGVDAQGGVVIEVKDSDLRTVMEALFPKLSEAVRAGITLKASEQIAGGFTISFDAGRSQFDFTDTALAEYLSASLRPALADILRGAAR